MLAAASRLLTTLGPTNRIQALAALFRPVLYPAIYPWFVAAASLDIVTTWIVLHLGGAEVNPVAARAIAGAGLTGMVLLKFAVVALVLWVCEYVGHARPLAGRRLAIGSVVANCVPVGSAVVQLVLYAQDTGAFGGA